MQNSFDPKEGTENESTAEAVAEESNGPVTAPLTEEVYEEGPEGEGEEEE